MKTMRRMPTARAAIVALLVAWVTACSGPRHELVAIPATDMSSLEPSVRVAVDRAQAEVDRVTASKPTE